MAKPIAQRGTVLMDLPSAQDAFRVPQRDVWWSPCKGMNTALPAQLLDNQTLVWAENVGIHYGFLRTRYGVANVGSAAASDITTVVEFVTSGGEAYLIRMGLFGVQYFDGTTWNTIAGYTAPVTMTVFDKFATTAFGDKMIFSDGLSGMYEYDPVAGAIQQIDGAPSAKHLTTLNGRVIASNVLDTDGLAHKTRVQWCVKNDSHDWDGIGSGFEDMLSTPGGFIDEQTGVYPIDDYAALVVRINSIWQMVESGNVEAPFRFERRFPGLGSKQRHSIVAVPGGIIGFFNDLSVYFITQDSIQPIGDPIRDPRWTKTGSRISWDATNFPNLLAVGTYNTRLKKYVLALSSRATPASGPAGFTAGMYEYDMQAKTWTYKRWAETAIHWVAFSSGAVTGLTIDSSTGNIEDAGSESIDSEVGAIAYDEQDVLVGAGSTYVYREDRSLLRDETTAYGNTPIAQYMLSKQLSGARPTDKVVITGFKVVYLSSVSGDITVRMHIWDSGAEETVDYVLPLQKSMSADESTVQGTRTAYVPLRASGYNVYFEVINSLVGRVDILGVVPEIETSADINTGATTTAMA